MVRRGAPSAASARPALRSAPGTFARVQLQRIRIAVEADELALDCPIPGRRLWRALLNPEWHPHTFRRPAHSDIGSHLVKEPAHAARYCGVHVLPLRGFVLQFQSSPKPGYLPQSTDRLSIRLLEVVVVGSLRGMSVRSKNHCTSSRPAAPIPARSEAAAAAPGHRFPSSGRNSSPGP